jgi:hypothetical protein
VRRDKEKKKSSGKIKIPYLVFISVIKKSPVLVDLGGGSGGLRLRGLLLWFGLASSWLLSLLLLLNFGQRRRVAGKKSK